MKRILSVCLAIICVICACFSASAFTPQNPRTYQSADDTGIYSIRFNGSHADITRYSSSTLNASVDVESSIRAVCAYRGKIVLFCENSSKKQLTVFVYYLDTDFLEGFVINNTLLSENTDFACDNGAIYIENYLDNRELTAFSYTGSYLGKHRFDREITALCGGYHSGIYAVSGDTLFSLSSDRFMSISGASVETSLFPADQHVFVSGFGSVYIIDGDRVTYAFSVDSDRRTSSACVIGHTLYVPCGNMVNAYDLDSGEKIAYYRSSFLNKSVYADGNMIIAVGDNDCISANDADFISLDEPDDTDHGANWNNTPEDPVNERSDSNYSREDSYNNSATQYQISSNVYQVDSDRFYISGISPQTTVASFKKNLNYDGYTIAVYRNSTIRKSGNVGTAMTAVFTSDEFIYTYELAVTGDITGEGSRNSRDLNVLMDYLIGSGSFNGAYTIAVDLNSDGKVDVCDLAILKSSI